MSLPQATYCRMINVASKDVKVEKYKCAEGGKKGQQKPTLWRKDSLGFGQRPFRSIFSVSDNSCI
eukprot:6188746-Pleurochrysis_carterae.AAC.3